MSAIRSPGRQQSITEAIATAQSAAEEPAAFGEGTKHLPPAAPSERLIPPAVGAAMDRGLLDRVLFPPARPQRRFIPSELGQAIDAGFFRRDWTDCGHEDIWMESGSCMACEPAWQTPAEREAREELDINRQPGEHV